MDDQDWNKFFDLLEQITKLEMPAVEKAELVKQKAKERHLETALDEFASWSLAID